MSAMPKVIEARQVSYEVRRNCLLADISLCLSAGTLTIAIGPNGAGKSTLLRTMSGELTCSRGIVLYDEIDIRSLPPSTLAARRAVMAQATRLAFDLSVYEVVRLGIEGTGRKLSRVEREKIMADALTRAEIFELAGRAYQFLSGGEQQRVQFARALSQILAAQNTKVAQALFLDEPTAHLDIAHQLMLMDRARALAKAGIAVFVTMHDLNLAAAYADHLVVLKSGYLVAQGRPPDVLSHELVANVFGVRAGMGEHPPDGQPFFLPHQHAAKGGKTR